MIGSLFGILFGVGLIIQAWDGSGITWYTAILVVVPFLLGLIFARTMGIALMWLSGLMVIALLVSVVKLDWPSAVGALGVGVAAFLGQLALGRIRPDAT